MQIAGVVAPGYGYGPQAPLIDLAGRASADRNAAMERISWTVPDGLLDIGPEPFVRAHVTAAMHRLSATAGAVTPVIIAYAQALGWSPLTFVAALADTPGALLVAATPCAHPRNWLGLPSTPVRPATVARGIRQALVTLDLAEIR